MTADMTPAGRPDWVDSCGLAHLLRTFRLAMHPAKLVSALAAILLMFAWGLALDRLWTAMGNGVSADALARHVGITTGQPAADEPVGVFRALRGFQTHCIRDAIESVRYGRLIGGPRAGESIGVALGLPVEHPVRGAFTNLVLMFRGFVWLCTEHVVYALLFVPVVLLIWAFFGGAICRITAFQFVDDEPITLKQSLDFAKDKLFAGLFVAPMIPLAFGAVLALLLVLGGLFLRIPWLGDVLGGGLFGAALLGGALIALTAVGTVAGGSLFWPTVAVESSDSFDAISRSFSYVLGRPLKALWYALVLVVYGSFSWLLVRFVVWVAVASTHKCVSLGAGIVSRGEGAADKLTAIWAPPTFENLLDMSSTVTGGEWVARGLIGLWLLPLVGLVWAFLASFYLSGSTVAYFLLRRDVDGTDLGELYLEDDRAASPAPAASSAEESVSARGESSTDASPEAKTAESETESGSTDESSDSDDSDRPSSV